MVSFAWFSLSLSLSLSLFLSASRWLNAAVFDSLIPFADIRFWIHSYSTVFAAAAVQANHDYGNMVDGNGKTPGADSNKKNKKKKGKDKKDELDNLKKEVEMARIYRYNVEFPFVFFCFWLI
jgi:hypothetical protein